MRKAQVYQKGIFTGILEEVDRNNYRFTYTADYIGEPVSLALRVRGTPYEFKKFPPVFEGLLPEGIQLEALLRDYKIDRHDLFAQLLLVGGDLVGALTVKEVA